MKCEIRDCPNQKRITKYGKNLCKYHYRLIEELKGKASRKLENLEWDRCEWCNSKVPRTITHHFSYSPEKTIELCDRCHQEVHNNEGNHVLAPSEYQKWQADLPIGKEDLLKIKQCGKVKLDDLGKGKVEEGYETGFKFSFEREEGSILSDRRYHSKKDVEFLEEKPWNLEKEEVKP